MFADDSKCYKCITSEADCAALQEDLSALSDWAKLNELEFLPRKCENLPISRKRISFSRVYRINHNAELKCVDSQKDLGVIVTGNLLWSSHIDSVSAKQTECSGFWNAIALKKFQAMRLKFFT
jgi:hypothetical protein